MSRGLTGDMTAAATTAFVRPVYLFRMAMSYFDAGAFCSLDRNIDYDGITYLGNGTFMGLSSIRETGDTGADTFEVILNSISETAVSAVLNYAYKSIHGQLRLGLLDSDLALIDAPILLFEGILDAPRLTETRNGLTMTLTYESTLLGLRDASRLRFSDASQKHLYPGDRGFEFLSELAAWEGYWGVKEKV